MRRPNGCSAPTASTNAPWTRRGGRSNRRKIAFAERAIVPFNAALKRQLASADLVVSVGGDGTLLRASHFVRDGMVIGVNSAPGDSVGRFCTANRENFAERLDAILALKWRPVELARLRVTLDGKTLPELALNDVLVLRVHLTTISPNHLTLSTSAPCVRV